jgi:hypothetical protein
MLIYAVENNTRVKYNLVRKEMKRFDDFGGQVELGKKLEET